MTDSQLIQSVIKMQEELSSAISELNRLTSDITSQRDVAKPSFASPEDERKQVLKFLFNLQKSGITNMLSGDEYIQKRFSFTITKSREYLFDYIDNYSEIAIMLSGIKVSSPLEAKKRKGPKPYSEMTPEELEQAKAKKARSKASDSSSIQSRVSESSSVNSVSVNPCEAETVAVPETTTIKKTIIKLKKNTGSDAPKSNAMLIWNAFMNTVRSEMGEGVPYDDVRKRAMEVKAGDPDSYKLFSENWSN